MRGGYENIVAWQQFYGLIYAFYCKVLHLKKRCCLVVMTFIYKDKNGIVGKIYKKFISLAICSEYIDKIVVYSKHEVQYYAGLFCVAEDKFQYIPLGIEDRLPTGRKYKGVEKPFLLSVGRSNRDYSFLFRCAKDLPYRIVVLTDCLEANIEHPDNVVIHEDISGDRYLQLLEQCEAVLLTLKDPNISSGQLVILQAMRYRKPIVITESQAIVDYVTDGKNAIVTRKKENEFVKAVIELMDNPARRESLAENGRKMYEEGFTKKALGERVGRLLVG